MEIFRHKCLNRSSGAINNASKIEQLYEKLHNTGSFIPSQMDGVIIQIGSHLINLRALLQPRKKNHFTKSSKQLQSVFTYSGYIKHILMNTGRSSEVLNRQDRA